MKKLIVSSVLILALANFASAGVLKTSYKVVKAVPKAAVKVVKVAYKVVV
jgi:hypothetical protein